MNEEPVGRTLLYWMGTTCREIREEAGVSVERISSLLDHGPEDRVSASKIIRFETAKTWPRDKFDDILAAYGFVSGTDPRDIVIEAGKRWKKNGFPPTLLPELVDSSLRELAQRSGVTPKELGEAVKRLRQAGS